MFSYRLILEDGSPLDPPTFVCAVPTWHEGDTFMIRPGLVSSIVSIRSNEDETVWTVERVK